MQRVGHLSVAGSSFSPGGNSHTMVGMQNVRVDTHEVIESIGRKTQKQICFSPGVGRR